MLNLTTLKVFTSHLALSALLFSSYSLAADTTKTQALAPSAESVAELLTASHADQAIIGARKYMHNMIKTMPREMQLLPQHRDIAAPFMRKMTQLVDTEVNWAKVKAPISKAYSEVFTQQEIETITAFYKTETGKKLVEQTPLLMSSSMQVTQQLMATITPQLQELQQAMIVEIEAFEKANKAKESTAAEAQ